MNTSKRKFSRVLLTAILLSLFASSAWSKENTAASSLMTLCYHDVKPRILPGDGALTSAVTTEDLIAQFSWLKANNYTPVSLEQVIEARAGRAPLPDKPVLLSFDDGYRNIYRYVYPLLQLFNYPAVIGLVGAWLSDESFVQYGEQSVPRDTFLSHEQIREMHQSGLISFASHSFDLHRGIRANPQGNLIPAAIARSYDEGYEGDEAYKQRIKSDLEKNIQLIQSLTGEIPLAFVWPYGEYSQTTIDIANELGIKIHFGLGDSLEISQNQNVINRVLVGHNMKISDFSWLVMHRYQEKPIRVAHIDLDYVYDPDPVQQEKNLGLLLDRIKTMHINTVYLQAFADPDGDGTVEQLYFPNRHLPMRADLFSRVAWQLRTRSKVKVYAWMPVMSFKLNEQHPMANKIVVSTNGEDKKHYRRLSIFNKSVRTTILEIYEDLAKHSIFHGLLFHDDATLNDYEDASPEALQTYRDWGLANSIDAIRANPEQLQLWTKHKTQFLIDWTLELKERVAQYHPQIKTARNLYARVILEPESETWFAQNLADFVRHYDYTAIMAMPHMERVRRPIPWLQELAKQSVNIIGSSQKLVFELQSKDWNRNLPIEDDELARQIQTLQDMGVIHYGYYPDDFITGRPNLDAIYSLMSLKQYVEP